MNASEILAFSTAALFIVVFAIVVLRATRRTLEAVPAGVDERLYRQFRLAARICACAVFGVGLVVLAGWLLGLPALRSVIPGAAPIRANIAVCYILAGFAIGVARDEKAVRRAAVSKGCGGAVFILGLLTLAEHALSLQLGIDELLARDLTPLEPGAMPGRMAVMTALVLTLLGLALYVASSVASSGRRRVVAAQYLALTTLLICLVTLAGYLYGANVVSGLALRVTMTLQSCVACSVLSLGVLLSNPHRGPMKALTSLAPGGTLARMLLPAALILPGAIGYLRWLGQRAGLYDTQFGVALFASANTAIFVSLILASAWLLNRLDHRRTLAEAELRQSEVRYRTLVESLPQVVWTASPDGRCDYLSRRWYDYTGTEEGKALGLRWTRRVHEEDREANTRRWLDSVRDGTPFDGEYRVLGSDGGYRWFHAQAVPLRDDAGKVLKWFGTSTDIEDRKRAEEAVRQLNENLEDRVQARTRELANAQARLKSIMSAATRAAFVAVGLDGKIQMFNSGAEQMLGYKEAEVLGKSPMMFHDPVQVEGQLTELSARLGRRVTLAELFLGAMEHGPGSEGEWTYIRKDRSQLEVILGLTPIRDAEGVLQGYLGVSTDITGRKALERALRLNNAELARQKSRAEEANRAKSDFLASMSHEIRTPMNAILGMADVLAESNLDAEQRSCVEVFQRAGANLLTLINDILDLSKIEAGRIELEQSDFSIRDVVGQVLELTSKRARDKGLDLNAQIADEVPATVTGDAMRLRQILINLVGNAIKFTERGSITLEVAVQPGGSPGELLFRVRDTGVGIPQESLQKIFQAFTQADSSTTRKYGGTGLGLAISKQLVESMNGKMEVTSTVGVGSEFSFTARFEVREGSTPRRLVSTEELRGCRALVIDDDPTNLRVMRHLLTGWGVSPVEFRNPKDALAHLRNGSGATFAFAIVDGSMPEMGGFEAAKEIAGIVPELSVILLSSDLRPGDVERSRQAGLMGYAAKPVDKADLLRMIRQSIRVEAPKVQVLEAVVKGQKQLRILAAEDAEDNRVLLGMYLKSTPHVVTFVGNGQQAIEARQAGTCDLILMDMQMPVMDGLTATRAIRDLEGERGLDPIPIIALTANASPADIEKSWDAGCNGHLTKPISKARLLREINEYTMEPAVEATTQAPPKAVAVNEISDSTRSFEMAVKELVPGYLVALREYAGQARELFGKGDLAGVGRIGHMVKGSAGLYGFAEIGNVFGAMEAAAQVSDREKLGQLLAEGENAIQRLPVPGA